VALDPRIPLGVNPIKIDSLPEVAARKAQLADLQGQTEQRQLQLQQMRQQATDQAAVKQALQASNGDLRKAAQAVMAINPELGNQLLQHAATADKGKVDLETAKIAHDLQIINFTGQLVGGPLSVKDDPVQAQQAWNAMLAQMRHAGLSTEGLPEQFDAGIAQRLDATAHTAKERLDTRMKEIDDQRAAAAAKVAAENTAADNKRADEAARQAAASAAESARHNRATEAHAASGASEPLIAIVGPDGKPVLVPRGQAVGKAPASSAAGAKPSTGVEKSTLTFFNRAKQADEELAAVEADVTKMGLGAQQWMARAPNWAQTETGQRYQQAQRSFTEARLRKDSGAAIPEGEFANDRQMYFAQPGDGPVVAAQKARARATVLASLAFGSGRALGEFYGDDADSLVTGYKARAATATKPPDKENPFRKKK
jgi:hypothetical protein